MGAAPSGWAAGPYYSFQGFSGYCYVDSLNPAVNYNNLFWLNTIYPAFPAFPVPTRDVTVFMKLVTPVPAGAQVFGVLMGSSAIPGNPSLRSYVIHGGAPPFPTYVCQADLVTTNFDPATLTYAGSLALGLINHNNYFDFPSLSLNADVEVPSLMSTPTVTGAIVYGVKLYGRILGPVSDGGTISSGGPGAKAAVTTTWALLKLGP